MSCWREQFSGNSYLALEEIAPAKQQIMVSRSFGQPVYELADLKNAVGSFVGRAAEKLRSQASGAGAVMVFAQTSHFHAPQYGRSVTVPIATTTNDTLHITNAALAGLALIYREGFGYSKAGAMLTELIDRDCVPLDLFSGIEQKGKSAALMATLDMVNASFGRGALTTGAAADGRIRRMRQDCRSPAYTTSWSDLIHLRR